MGAKFVVIIAAMALIFMGNNENFCVDAREIVVGDDAGWSIPASSTFYSSWASKRTFSVGDTLVFNFELGFHTVALVNKDSFEKCDSSNTISVMTNAPARVPLNSTGQLHFICVIAGHCSAGQKLAIDVIAGHHLKAPAPAPASASSHAVSSLTSSQLGIFVSFPLALVLFVVGFFS